MKRIFRSEFGCQLHGRETRFRLWAPAATDVVLEYSPPGGKWHNTRMETQGNGWMETRLSDCGAGSRYRFQIDGTLRVPDPASRFQPEGVHGASEVIDPETFDWRDGDWHGRPWEETVLYELHLGCFSPEGNCAGLRCKLDHLVQLGVTAVELMPLSQAPGRRNWGYDGTYPFAPNCAYGRPEALKTLVQEAHLRGLMVFLDVVYNHFGPEGNYLHAYAPDFFTDRHHTPWGQAINFDGERSAPVRRFFIDNALYWLIEYHLDGLRLDAVHSIFDDSSPDILEELAAEVRRRIAPNRQVHLVLENDHNTAHYLRPGKGYNAQWNDDIHHCLHTLLTGEDQGYYVDYARAPLHHLQRCLSQGFSYQGDYSPFRGEVRGEPSSHLPPHAFVAFLQNHDQTGNRAFGERIAALSEPAALRAVVSILLLAPSPPLLFMGEEWGALNPFLYFCDFEGELADAVREGRQREFRHFPEFANAAAAERLPDPNASTTFERSRLNWCDVEHEPHRNWLAFYQRLLSLRHRHIIPLIPTLTAGLNRATGLAGLLQIEWSSGDHTGLHLLSNLSDQYLEAPVAALQQLLFATQALDPLGEERYRLPPWHTSWYLQRSGRGDGTG